MSIRIIEHCELPREAEFLAEWDRLQTDVEDSTLFTSAAWVGAWFETFGAGKRLRLLEIRSGVNLIGIVALVLACSKRSPTLAVYHDLQPEDKAFVVRPGKGWLRVRQVSVPANLESANLRGGWLCRPAHRIAVLKAAFDYLGRISDWDVLLLPLVKTEEVREVIDCARHARFVRSRILLEDALFGFAVRDWQQYLAEQSKVFRKSFRGAINRFNALDGALVETVTDPARILAAIDAIAALARTSWKDQGRSGQAVCLPLTPNTQKFYRLLTERLAPRGQAQLFAISVHGQLAGCLLAYSADRRLYAMQTFYDPAIAHVSPGRMLMRELIQWASSNGISWVDMNGNSAFATAYSEHCQQYQRLMFFRPSLYSNVLYGLSSAARMATRIRGAIVARGDTR